MDTIFASLSTTLVTLLIMTPPLLAALILHEVAHARAAYYFGDTTARWQGHSSINSLFHFDLFGTVILPLLLFFSTDGKFIFGYVRSAPFNPANFRNPKKHMGLVALAGPASNFAQALVWVLVGTFAGHLQLPPWLNQMAGFGLQINLVLCAINLLPLPPLDGGRMLVSVLPGSWSLVVAKLEAYGGWLLIGLILLQILNIVNLLELWIGPVTAALANVLQLILFFFL